MISRRNLTRLQRKRSLYESIYSGQMNKTTSTDLIIHFKLNELTANKCKMRKAAN
jgi:hypothetical protein